MRNTGQRGLKTIALSAFICVNLRPKIVFQQVLEHGRLPWRQA